MAVLYASNYVWMHHIPVARELEITDDELQAVRTARYEGLSSREQAVLALTDELVDARTIRREVWDTHRRHLRDVEIVDLVHLVAQYVFFTSINNAVQVAIDEGLTDIPAIDDPIGPQPQPESRSGDAS
jgi:alkylhydroperoxidase family enzyme